jgi:hypothetical protein
MQKHTQIITKDSDSDEEAQEDAKAADQSDE